MSAFGLREVETGEGGRGTADGEAERGRKETKETHSVLAEVVGEVDSVSYGVSKVDGEDCGSADKGREARKGDAKEEREGKGDGELKLEVKMHSSFFRSGERAGETHSDKA